MEGIAADNIQLDVPDLGSILVSWLLWYGAEGQLCLLQLKPDPLCRKICWFRDAFFRAAFFLAAAFFFTRESGRTSRIGIRLARFAVWVGLICWLMPAPSWAQPLNLADPTSRTIQVEFEISADPGTVGQTYSESFDATYSVMGNTGTVSISSAVYESAVQTHDLDYFDTMMVWSLIGGSASDFSLDIDLTTMEATAQPLSYQVLITDPVPFPQIGTVTRGLSTAATAGFAFLPQFPDFPFFCDACTLVPGAPYDPVTGKINAVGSDHLVAPDIPSLTSFSRAGDLRLSESPVQAAPALTAYGLWGLAVVVTSFALLMIRRERRGTQAAA